MPVRASTIDAGDMDDDFGADWTGASESELAGVSGCAAGAAGVPALGCGAGLGTGTLCAIAAAVRLARMVHATAARLAFRIASSAPAGATYRAGMAISRPNLKRWSPTAGASQVRCRASIALGRLLANQDFPLARMIGGADDPLFLHALHDRGGAVVADLQAALDVA